MKDNHSENVLTPLTTTSRGIGGIIKQFPEDFIVGEIIDKNCRLNPRAVNINLPGKPGLFLHFVLEKNDIDTSDALDWLARLWKIDRNDISIAGSKDKKALTAQRVSIWGLKDKFENGELKNIDLPTLKTHSSCLRLKQIRLGELWGNSFDITIRNIEYSKEQTKELTEKTFENIKSNGGILNGFGVQRFGDTRPITHEIGKILLFNDFKLAIKTYIGKVYGNETKEIQDARKLFWETEDCRSALDVFPKFLTIERKMLKELLRRRMDYEQVFFSLPLQFRKLFIHAFQAKLFNRYLAKRWKDYSQDLKSEISGELVNNGQIFGPVIGTKSDLSGDIKKIYQEILYEEGIDHSIFQNPITKKLGGQGTYREISFTTDNLEIHDSEKDEHNKDKTKIRIMFDIPKGSYATELLREIMKN